MLSPEGKIMELFKMPDTDADIFNRLSAIWLLTEKAFLEEVASRPDQGVHSVFKFGMGFGGLRMALVACRIPFEIVRPQVWQQRMGCLTRGDKNVSKKKAQQLWPERVFTHATADAALIAEYGRRFQLGLL